MISPPLLPSVVIIVPPVVDQTRGDDASGAAPATVAVIVVLAPRGTLFLRLCTLMLKLNVMDMVTGCPLKVCGSEAPWYTIVPLVS